MAEGLLQHYGKGKFNAYSAGSFPSGKINQQAIETLQKNNIQANYASFKSQSWDEFENIKMDIVITVCDSAAGETCPLFLGNAIKAHWGVFDPSTIKTEVAFDEAFAILERRIKALVALQNITASNLQEIAKHG